MARSNQIKSNQIYLTKGSQGHLHCNTSNIQQIPSIERTRNSHYIKYTLQNLTKTLLVNDCFKAL